MNLWNYILNGIKCDNLLTSWFNNNEMFDYYPEILSHDYSDKIETYAKRTILHHLSLILTGLNINVEIISNERETVEIGRSKKDYLKPSYYITIQYIPGHFQLVELL